MRSQRTKKGRTNFAIAVFIVAVFVRVVKIGQLTISVRLSANIGIITVVKTVASEIKRLVILLLFLVGRCNL